MSSPGDKSGVEILPTLPTGSQAKPSRNFQLTINHKLDLVLPVEWDLINEIAISPRLSNKMTKLG